MLFDPSNGTMMNNFAPSKAKFRRRDWKFGLGLRALIVMAPVMMLLLVLAIVAYGLTGELKHQAEARAREDLATLGKHITRRIESIAQLAAAIQKFQTRSGVVPMPGVLEDLQVLLESQPKMLVEGHETPEIQGVYIAYEDIDYRSPMANPWYDWKEKGKKFGGYKFQDCAEARNQWYCGVKDLAEGNFGVTGPYFDESGAEMGLISITMPIRDGAKFVGVAGADFKLDVLGKTIKSLIRGSGYAYLVSDPLRDAVGSVVFATTDPLGEVHGQREFSADEKSGKKFPPVRDFPLGDRIERSASGLLQEPLNDQGGERQLISWQALKIPGSLIQWKIVRSVPYDAIWGRYDRIKSYCLWRGLPLLMIITLLAMWLAERALGPIPLLAATAAAVEQENYDVEALAGVAQRRDEMGQLARALRKMVGVISNRETELNRSKEELARRERHFRALIDNSSDLVSIINSDGSLRYWSPSVRGILGYEPDEAVGRRALDFAHPEEHQQFVAMMNGMGTGLMSPKSVEYRLRHKDGSYRVMEGTPTDLCHDPDVGGVVLNSRDITGRKADENKILRLADDLKRERDGLEDRVHARTAELEQANDNLLVAKEATEQAMKQKDVFLDNVAHDLRTPLAVVLGYSKDLHEQAIEDELDDYAADLGKVINRGQDLLDFVNDLLLLSKSRGDSGVHLDLSRFDIGKMLDERLGGLDWLAKNTDNTIVTRVESDLGTMMADEVKVWRILMNLLTNACKFTLAGGRIEISAARNVDQGQDWVVFRVADTGRGMTPEQQSRLFKRFSQVQGTAAEQRDGVGLGLSICQLYCHAMNGRISVESTEGHGTTFTVRLPAIVAPKANKKGSDERLPAIQSLPIKALADPASSQVLDQQQPRGKEEIVLIIDDDPLICELMQRNLEGGGIATRTAHDGIEGLRMARELQPSAIVLDVLMPVIDGWAVLATLKTDPLTSKIPVIMASVLDERQRGLTMGADDYVSKPVTRELMAQLLQKHLDGREAGRLLVVEDDPDLRSRLCRSLRQQGWEVIESGDGAEALELIRERQPDLVLLDLLLPTLDGFEIVEEMMKDSQMRLIPVVVMTSGTFDDQVRSRLDGHVEQVLQKGTYDRKELLRSIRSLVREHQQRISPQAVVPADG